MTDHILHIGTTTVVIGSSFGLITLGISEMGRAVERVAAFDSPVAASRFVAAVTRGLEDEGSNPGTPRFKRPSMAGEEEQPLIA